MTTLLETPEVIAVHGLFGSGDSLEKLVNHAGGRTINVDSSRPWAPNLNEWAYHVEHALWESEHTTRRVIAHSLGAVPALRAVSADPLAKVVLLNPFLRHGWASDAVSFISPENITILVGKHDVVTNRQGSDFAEKHGVNLIELDGVSHSGFLPGMAETWPPPVFALERAVNTIVFRRSDETLPHAEQFEIVAQKIREGLDL